MKRSLRRYSIFAGLVAALWVGRAHAQAVSTGTPTTLLQPVPTATANASGLSFVRKYYLAVNVGSAASGDGVAWCTYAGTPGIHAPGSFMLAPFGYSVGYPSAQEFADASGAIVPQGGLICVSDGGSTGSATAKMTVVTRP